MPNRKARRQRGKILAKKWNLETFSKAIYDSTKQKINSIATDNTITVVLSVLHREYGFGPKRSRDFYQHVADLTSRINRKTETIAGLKNELHDQCGLTLARKVNDDGGRAWINQYTWTVAAGYIKWPALAEIYSKHDIANQIKK